MRHEFNPCDIDRFAALAPLGDALAFTFNELIAKPTHGCPCCMMVRVLLLMAATAGLTLAGVWWHGL